MRISPAALTLAFVLPTLAAAAPPPAVEDGSGPRAALLMYDKMVGPHETDRALGLYHATNTRERAAAAVLAKIDGALANLRKQAVAKFGPEAADALLHTVKASTTADINAAKITVSGDTASVQYPGDDSPSQMVRVDGEWKVSVKAALAGPDSHPRAYRKAITTLTQAVDRVADKIQQGQFAKPEAAIEELKAAYKAQFLSTDD